MQTISIATHTAEVFQEIFSVLAPPPDMTLSQWADAYRYLSPEASASPGRWRTDKVPYMREIMDAITDIRVQKVVVMSAAQVGKTDGPILNTIGYYMHYDPCSIMVIQPTITMGEAFSKERLSSMLRDTPALSGLINEKSRNSGNKILQKQFPGGFIAIVGANAPSGLAMRPIRALLADEIDRYPATAGNEGDPLVLASKRQATFWNRKEVNVSTPTIKGMSRIEAEYEHSTKEVWTIPCPHCGEYQPFTWGQVVFDRTNLDEIGHTCRKCGVVSNEIDWKQSSTKGKFKAEFPNRKVRGFHLNSFASLLGDWRRIVESFLFADSEKKKGNLEPLKSWTNTELGETWEEQGEQVADDTLYERRELYGCEVPADVICLTAGVDVQHDRLELELVGWGEGKESWGVEYKIIYGDTKEADAQVWKDLDEYLLSTFTRADGAKLKVLSACIDSGDGNRSTTVYRFCKPRYNRRIYAVKGKGGADREYISKPTKNNRIKCPVFTLGVDTGKSLLLDRLKVDYTEETGSPAGPGYCHFPLDKGKGYDKNYFMGLTSERQVMHYKKGRPVFKWVIKDAAHRRNEALDCRNYAAAALEISNPPLVKSKPITQTATPPPRRSGRRARSGGIK